MGSRFAPKQRILMQSVELLRQRFPADSEALEELAAITDRLEQIAETADMPKSIRSQASRNSTDSDAGTAVKFPDGRTTSRNAD